MLQLSFLKITFTFRFSAGDILAELRPSRRKFNIYSDTVCQTYFIDENKLRKNHNLLQYSLPHYRALYCAAIIRHLQSQHPVSTFGIEKACGSMKTLSAIQKMLVSPADFSTRPEGRALWEESLVLSKIHSSIRADEWNFCPLKYIVIKVEYGLQLHFKIFLNKSDRKTKNKNSH